MPADMMPRPVAMRRRPMVGRLMPMCGMAMFFLELVMPLQRHARAVMYHPPVAQPAAIANVFLFPRQTMLGMARLPMRMAGAVRRTLDPVMGMVRAAMAAHIDPAMLRRPF